MASSQTSSHSQKRDQIIDGRLFSRTTVMDRIISEVEDNDCMERIISKIEEQCLYRLGHSHTETYDELIVEEFYRDASVKSHSRKHGGAIISISASVQGIAICINQELLETMFGLPYDSLTMEELESFGSDKLLTVYWDFSSEKAQTRMFIHPAPRRSSACPSFCCRIIENRPGAFATCTNLRFRMMIVILYGEKFNWSQIVLKRLSEEVSKPHSQKKSFGLLLNNILTRSGVRQSKHAKKIGSGKFIGGYKPSAYHQAGPTANRPFLNLMPSAKNPRGTSKKTSTGEDVSSKERKRSVSDSKSPLTEKKKHKKASKSKARGTVTDPVTISDVPAAQPVDHQTQGETPTVESTSRPVDPKPTASNDQIFAGLENLNELTAHMESFVSSPVRAPIPKQDPTHYMVPSPSRDPTPNRVPTPVRDSSLIQDPTPVEDPVPTVNPIPVRSPSPSAKSLSDQVEQAFTRFIKWKSYRTAPYDVLSNWKEWREEEQFILDVTDSKEILLLILMENDQCKELIFGHYLDLNHFEPFHPVQPDSTPVPVAVFEEASRDIPREDQVPLPEQSEAERQQEPAPTPVPLSSEPEPSHIASSSFRRPESPRTKSRKEQLNALGRQSLFIQDAVEALYQVGKEMDWLNLTASVEMESVNVELTKIAEAFSTLPQDLKEAFAKFQHLEEQSLLEEQSKLRTVESKTVAILEYTDSRISDNDAKISEMAKVISSFDEKLAKFEEQQDNVLKVLRSIDHTFSELNAK
ncbi:hypothetical protein OROHE_005651 [Orobanche hederae]